MKKTNLAGLFLIIIFISLLTFGIALASGIDDSIHNSSSSQSGSSAFANGGKADASAIGIGGSSNVHTSVSNSVKTSTEVNNRNAQGQLQGQLQGQKQTSVGKVDTNVGGDTIKGNYSLSFPSVSAAEGTNNASATYLFGSLGISDTEMYKKGIATIQTILAIPDSIIPQADKQLMVKQVVNKMMNSIRAKRWCIIGPEQHSKNLFNLFGLLSGDSFWDENQKPFQSKSDIKQ